MLNLSCVICSEIFSHTDQVFATKCGHMFHYNCIQPWLIRSNSCPQCRDTCTLHNIYRLYFNLDDMSGTVNIDSLKERLENANLLAECYKIDLNLAEEKVKKLNADQIKFIKTISQLEQKIKTNDSLISSYNTKLKSAQKSTNEANSLRNEVKHLKDQMTKMRNVSSILTSNAEDAERLLKDKSNPTTLAVCVSALKKECQSHKTKITEYENVMRSIKADLGRATALNKNKCSGGQGRSRHNGQITQDRFENGVHWEEECEARSALLGTNFKSTLDCLEMEFISKEECIASLNLEKSQIKKQLKSSEMKKAELETKYKSTLDRLERECILKEQYIDSIASLNLEKADLVRRCREENILKGERASLALERSKLKAEFEAKRRHMEAVVENMQDQLDRKSYIIHDQENQISSLNCEIFILNQRLNCLRYENERLSGFGIGVFGTCMIVLGGSIAFCLYRNSVLAEINVLNEKLEKCIPFTFTYCVSHKICRFIRSIFPFI